MCPKLACALCWKTSFHEIYRTDDALNRGLRTYVEAHNLLWDFRVEYPGTWLQRLLPADPSSAELVRRYSCGMDKLVDDIELRLRPKNTCSEQ